MDRKHWKIILIFFVILVLICMYISIDTYASSPTPEPTDEPTPEPTVSPSPEPTPQPSTLPEGEYTDDDIYEVLQSINTTLYYIEFVLVAMLAFMAVWYFTQRV